MCSRSQGFYGDQPDLSYDRVAGYSEIRAMERVAKLLTERGEVVVDESTKEPYIVYDKVRYDIEPEYEQEIDAQGL